MRKIISVILFGFMMTFILCGCKGKSTDPDENKNAAAPDQASTVSPGTAAGPGIAEGEDENLTEDSSDLLPGFEVWEKDEAVKALNKVLMMEADFRLVNKNGDDLKAIELITYRLDKINQIQKYKFEKHMVPDKYAVTDMDQDGTPELAVQLLTEEDSWIILLRYYDGDVYGYFFEARALQSPKTNGRYIASSGGFDEEILKMSFDGYYLKEERAAYSRSDNESREYYIADKKVTEREYNDYYSEFYLSENVTWQLFPSDIRAGYRGEKLFEVDFKAVTHAEYKTLDSYYSEMENEMTFTHSSRIPVELCDIIKDAMQAGKEEEIISPLVIGTELSQEEFSNLTGFKQDYGAVSPFRADIDNDGKEDLLALVYRGGTGGFSSMELYKAVDDEYKLSSSFECLSEKFYVISYQGKNYLLKENFDYNTKYYSGYDLYLYEAGKLADGVNFYFSIKDYDMNIAYENDHFSGIEQIRNTLTNRNMPKILESNDGVIYGTAEIINKSDSVYYKYSSDIDNDGDTEAYHKYMWYPSNMGTVMQCNYDFEDSNVLEDLWARLEDEVGEGRLYTFWLDKVNDKNIIYLYVGNNLDFSLYACLLESVK